MQARRVVFLMLLFTLAAATAYAQTCPPPVVTPAPVLPVMTCPQATCPSGGCPTSTCMPEPTCAPACPQPAPTCGCGPATIQVPYCPTANPCPVAPVAVPSCAVGAGFGGGPLQVLQTSACDVNFDRLYIENMYTLHNNVIALATQGANQATDRNLRDLSRKIIQEQTDQNRKLAMWYGQFGCCGTLNPGDCAAGGAVQCLAGICGPQFDAVYAQTMSDMLMTLRDSAAVSVPKIQNADLRYQANLVARVSDNEVIALQRWIADHGLGGRTF